MSKVPSTPSIAVFRKSGSLFHDEFSRINCTVRGGALKARNLDAILRPDKTCVQRFEDASTWRIYTPLSKGGWHSFHLDIFPPFSRVVACASLEKRTEARFVAQKRPPSHTAIFLPIFSQEFKLLSARLSNLRCLKFLEKKFGKSGSQDLYEEEYLLLFTLYLTI